MGDSCLPFLMGLGSVFSNVHPSCGRLREPDYLITWRGRPAMRWFEIPAKDYGEIGKFPFIGTAQEMAPQ
jgi:hypothetical protein